MSYFRCSGNVNHIFSILNSDGFCQECKKVGKNNFLQQVLILEDALHESIFVEKTKPLFNFGNSHSLNISSLRNSVGNSVLDFLKQNLSLDNRYFGEFNVEKILNCPVHIESEEEYERRILSSPKHSFINSRVAINSRWQPLDKILQVVNKRAFFGNAYKIRLNEMFRPVILKGQSFLLTPSGRSSFDVSSGALAWEIPGSYGTNGSTLNGKFFYTFDGMNVLCPDPNDRVSVNPVNKETAPETINPKTDFYSDFLYGQTKALEVNFAMMKDKTACLNETQVKIGDDGMNIFVLRKMVERTVEIKEGDFEGEVDFFIKKKMLKEQSQIDGALNKPKACFKETNIEILEGGKKVRIERFGENIQIDLE